MIDLDFFPKNPYPKFLVAQNCIKKGSRNIYIYILLKKVISINSLILYCVSPEQYLTYLSVTNAVLENWD